MSLTIGFHNFIFTDLGQYLPCNKIIIKLVLSCFAMETSGQVANTSGHSVNVQIKLWNELGG